MKRIFIPVSLTILLFSCAKEENVESVQSESQAKPTGEELLHESYRGGVEDMYHMVSDFPKRGDLHCFRPATNCLPTLVVYRTGGRKSGSLVNLENSLRDNNGSDFFATDNYLELFPALSEKIADKIASGKYIVTKKTDSFDSNTDIYIVLDSKVNANNFKDKDVIVAMQITHK